jgi:hypothetical protein
MGPFGSLKIANLAMRRSDSPLMSRARRGLGAELDIARGYHEKRVTKNHETICFTKVIIHSYK